jgi:putative intracellular protease/amidase
VSPFKGYRVTGFTNEEEAGVGMAYRSTWLLETDLKEKVGVNFSRGEIWKPCMKPCMVEDRNLITGQNPASAAVLGKRLLEVLKSAGPQVRSASGRQGEEAGASRPH